MARTRLQIGQEAGDKRVFAWVIDWPGWCRGAKTVEAAHELLLAYGPRYLVAANAAGLDLPDIDGAELDVIESVGGGSGTDFGVPSVVTDDDRRAATKAQAERLAALVEAAWAVFDEVAAGAPASLRKGPRGGGRDRDMMIAHVVGSDHAYAHEIGLRGPETDPTDRVAVESERAAMLQVLRRPSDGSPLADRRWPSRYAMRRIAWHALDHAWEMEDRSER
jgi:hypothetical protein